MILLKIIFFVWIAVLASGIWALPFAIASKIKRKKRILVLANAWAAWLMLGVSIVLVYEGLQISYWQTLLWLALGIAFIRFTSYLIQKWGGIEKAKKLFFTHMPHRDFAKALLIVWWMSFHAIAEGIGLGVGFAKGEQLWILLALAMTFHNIPEWMAVASILVPRGVPWFFAWWWAVFTSMPQLLFAILAYIFVSIFSFVLPIGLWFAAWSMIWLGIREVFEEALKLARNSNSVWALVISLIALVVLTEILI